MGRDPEGRAVQEIRRAAVSWKDGAPFLPSPVDSGVDMSLGMRTETAGTYPLILSEREAVA